MKAHILLVYFLILIFNCCSKPNNKKQSNKEMDTETEILKEALKNHNYKLVNKDDFLEKAKVYFGSDVFDQNPSNDGQLLIGKNDYQLDIQNQFINTFPESIFYNPNTKQDQFTKEQALHNLNNLTDYSTAKFLAYNKLLFNDDNLSSLFFLQNLDEANEIVIDFGYEKNEKINTMVVSKIDTENFDEKTYRSVLMFNNDNIRSNFITKILKIKGDQFLFSIAYGFIENMNAYKPMSYDNTLIFVLNNLKKDKTNITNDFSYNLISLLDKKNSEMIKRIEVNPKTNLEVKEIINSFYINKDSGDSNDKSQIGYIKDTDGFVNVRENNDVNSNIIGRINNNEKIFYTPSSGSMWMVQTADGSIKGYVHKSRIVNN